MPVPQGHKQSLDSIVTNLKPEHKHLAGFLRNQQLSKALDEMHDNPSALQEAKRDPKGFFERKGAQPPPDVTIRIEEGSWTVYITLEPVCIAKYNSDAGWSWC